MMEEYGIDGLTSYQLELIDETAKVVNPAYRKLEGQIKNRAGKLGQKRVLFGANTLRGELNTSDIARYQGQPAALKEELDFLSTELTQLKHQHAQTAKQITLGELPEADRFAQLAPIRKQLSNTIKINTYHANTAMALMLKDILARPDDACALLQEGFTTAADLRSGVLMLTFSILMVIADIKSVKAIKTSERGSNHGNHLWDLCRQDLWGLVGEMYWRHHRSQV
jgi:hypothetical protein